MVQTIEQAIKNENKRIKIPAKIRPFDVGYRIVNKNGQALALRNGASIFALPSLAEKAIKKEFGKNDPDFDIKKHSVEEVAIINLSKFHSYFEEVERWNDPNNTHLDTSFLNLLKMKILSLTKIANITSRRKKKRKIPFLKEISPKIDGRFEEVTE